MYIMHILVSSFKEKFLCSQINHSYDLQNDFSPAGGWYETRCWASCMASPSNWRAPGAENVSTDQTDLLQLILAPVTSRMSRFLLISSILMQLITGIEMSA